MQVSRKKRKCIRSHLGDKQENTQLISKRMFTLKQTEEKNNRNRRIYHLNIIKTENAGKNSNMAAAHVDKMPHTQLFRRVKGGPTEHPCGWLERLHSLTCGRQVGGKGARQMRGFMHKRGDLRAEQVIILQLAGTRLRKGGSKMEEEKGGQKEGEGRKEENGIKKRKERGKRKLTKYTLIASTRLKKIRNYRRIVYTACTCV